MRPTRSRTSRRCTRHTSRRWRSDEPRCTGRCRSGSRSRRTRGCTTASGSRKPGGRASTSSSSRRRSAGGSASSRRRRRSKSCGAARCPRRTRCPSGTRLRRSGRSLPRTTPLGAPKVRVHDVDEVQAPGSNFRLTLGTRYAGGAEDRAERRKKTRRTRRWISKGERRVRVGSRPARGVVGYDSSDGSEIRSRSLRHDQGWTGSGGERDAQHPMRGARVWWPLLASAQGCRHCNSERAKRVRGRATACICCSDVVR
ncbi:hypothetical protein LXA43DRAFT_277516 [Ganoderma leucocontextum]|nr:hypothetical protein LXA43DRAFT_277516 [Ganoderma leucocontextum]